VKSRNMNNHGMVPFTLLGSRFSVLASRFVFNIRGSVQGSGFRVRGSGHVLEGERVIGLAGHAAEVHAAAAGDDHVVVREAAAVAVVGLVLDRAGGEIDVAERLPRPR
jgi:hypothetical protein